MLLNSHTFYDCLPQLLRLMRAGRIEEADALAHRIGCIIEHRNTVHLRHTAKADATDMWRKVRQLTDRQRRSTEAPTGITAEELNRHYANVSTDTSYQPPPTKSTCSSPSDLFTEFQVFRRLDSLHHTATGLDDIPAWFLKIGAPLLSLSSSGKTVQPLSQLCSCTQSVEGCVHNTFYEPTC